MPGKYAYYPIPFTLDMILHDYNKVDTKFDDLLKILWNFFSSFSFRSLEIKSITHGSDKYRFERDCFVSCSCYDPKDTNIVSLQKHGPNPIFWKGTLIFMSTQQQEMNNFISTICNKVAHDSYLGIGLIWRFSNDLDKDFQNLIGVNPNDYDKHFATLNAKSFAFGNIIGGNHFVSHFRSDNSSSFVTMKPIDEIHVNLRYIFKYLELQFRVNSSDSYQSDQKFRLRYEFCSIKEVTVCKKTSNTMTIYFRLSYPPKILTDKALLDRKIIYADRNVKNDCSRDRWTRWHNCGSIPTFIMGKSNVLKLEIQSMTDDGFQTPISSMYVWRRFNPLDINYGLIQESCVIKEEDDNENTTKLPIEVRFGLECIKSLSFSFHDDLAIISGGERKLTDFILCQIQTGKTKQVVESLHRLFSVYQVSKVYDAFEHFQWIFNKVIKEWKTIGNIGINNSSCIKYLRRCILTPTRVLLLPPCPFQSSFFLEAADPDYTMRALIRDEDFSSLSFSVAQIADDFSRGHKTDSRPDCREYFLKKVIENRLLSENGLHVAGRVYQYYGASSSQFREAGMILYAADDKNRSAQSLRKSLGVINEKSVSKYCARVGLSLSQVMAFVKLPPNIKILASDDIYKGCHSKTGKPYNFTDGCGFLSPLLAQYIWNQLIEQKVVNVSSVEKATPSAYQIRFMGAKGMVCIDDKLDGMTIVLRKSMLKMNGSRSELGILKVSEPRRAYLNAPFITILNQIGLSKKFFINLLMRTVEYLVASFDNNEAAICALKMFSSLHRFVNYEKLDEAGFKLHHDHFFRSILMLVFNQGLDVIKRKARIPLPLTDARTMFGVSDPSVNLFCPKKEIKFNEKGVSEPPELDDCSKAFGKGVLKKGQVFVWPSDLPEPITGDIIVTKFPSTHSGDVQRLKAMNHKELHAIRDCIVFPVDGNRPHSDEMAGSDLDGDEYCVIWAKEFNNITVTSPMEYPAGQNGVTCDNITDKEMIRFHMKYLQECAIGKIAKAHLAWSDLKGIDSEKCQELAVKYAGALDFAKQGIEDSFRFHRKDKYPEAPDFMEKHASKPSYHSTRALGALYQVITQFQLYLADEINVKQMIEPYIDPRLEHPQWMAYKKSAQAAYAKYEAIVEHLLLRCDFSSESELLSQIFEKNSVFRQTPEEGGRSNDHEDCVVAIVKTLLVKEMEKDFDNEFNVASSEDLAEARMAKASAFYIYTLQQAKKTKLKCFGLPWIGNYSKYLLQLLHKKLNASRCSPLLASFNNRFIKSGFSGSRNDKNEACHKIYTKLNFWINEFFWMTGMDRSREQCRLLADRLNNIFELAIRPYCNGERINQCSGKVLLRIFREVQELNGLKIANPTNLFTSYNNPMGQIVIGLLEQELSNSLIVSEKMEFFTNHCFMVRTCNRRKGRVTCDQLVKVLKHLCDKAEIRLFDTNEADYIPLAVYSTPASLLVAQVLVGIHNRLCSINLPL